VQTVRFSSHISAHLIAAEERHRADLAAVERYRLTEPAPAERPALVTAIAGARSVLGAAPIRAGVRLRGWPVAGRRSAANAAGH
jgi:hypothetical protein